MPPAVCRERFCLLRWCPRRGVAPYAIPWHTGHSQFQINHPPFRKSPNGAAGGREAPASAHTVRMAVSRRRLPPAPCQFCFTRPRLPWPRRARGPRSLHATSREALCDLPAPLGSVLRPDHCGRSCHLRDVSAPSGFTIISRARLSTRGTITRCRVLPGPVMQPLSTARLVPHRLSCFMVLGDSANICAVSAPCLWCGLPCPCPWPGSAAPHQAVTETGEQPVGAGTLVLTFRCPGRSRLPESMFTSPFLIPASGL